MAETEAASAEGTIILQEFEACEVAVSVQTYALLRDRYAGKIEVGPTERGGVYRIAARDHVGRIGLPGGGMLVIRPKVSVTNLFYMLSGAAGLAHFYPPPTGLAPNTEIFSFILSLLVSQVESLLRAGLYRAYVASEADLPFVRGRIV